MHRLALISASLAMLIGLILPASAQSRLALVIANSAYQDAAPLNTTIADATLIAATLQAAGYDVTGLTNVGKDDIGAVIGQFRDKLAAAGPDAVVFLYFAGYGAQLNGDDYLVPVDAQIDSPDALSSQALPLSAIVSTLAQVPAAARIIVLDAARDHEFGKKDGQPVAPGLALIGAPAPGFLIAYSAAPNQVAPDGDLANSPFASALATLMRQPGLDIEQILKGVRVQVNQASKGTQTPWMTSSLDVEVKLFDAPPAAADASAPAPATAQTLAPALGVVNIPVPSKRKRHVTKAEMKQMPADEAYRTAIEDDSLPDYQSFVETHPDYSLAGQVWNIIHNIREGVLWDRALTVDSTAAYWNYLDRYPDGDHAWEARDWLESHGQPLPPPGYVAQPLDLPPGYYDEATDVPEIFPDGSVAPAPVFGDYAPIFVPPPPPWDRQPTIINVLPAPPLPNVAPAPTPVAPLPTSNQAQANGNLPLLSPTQPVAPTPIAPLPTSNQAQADGNLPLAPLTPDLKKMTDKQLKDALALQIASYKAKQAQANGKLPSTSPTPDLKKMTDKQLIDAAAEQIAKYKAEQAKKQALLAKKFNLPPATVLPVIANVVD